MIKLDDNLLQELGLAVLHPEEKKKMLAHIYETLEMRVGMELAKQMTDAQLNEFEEFINRNDEAGALRWLETNFPNYKEVVAAEFEKLKMEIRQVAPQILASNQQFMPPQAAPTTPNGDMPSGYPASQPAYGSPVPMGYQQSTATPPPSFSPSQQPPHYPPAPSVPPMYGDQGNKDDYDLAG
jgi:hypothetical protein